MTVRFRPLVPGAAYLRDFAKRLGRKLLRGGGAVAHQVVDGYLLRATRRGDKDASVVAVDTPRYLASPWWGQVTASGVAPFVTLDLPDAVSRLGDAPRADYPAVLLGFYAASGVVRAGAAPDDLRYARWMAGPTTACRTALLTGVQAQRFAGGERVGYITQVVRQSAAVKLAEGAPAGIDGYRLTRSLAAYDGSPGGVGMVELDDAALGVPALTVDLSRFAGPALEFSVGDGLVSFDAWHDATTFYERRLHLARYAVAPVPEGASPPSHTATVVWSTSVSVDAPVGATGASWFYPQTWSLGAPVARDAAGSQQILLLAQGFHTVQYADPIGVTGTASTIDTYLLAVDWVTGTATRTLLERFDTAQLNTTDLVYREFIPSATCTVDDAPRLLCAVRRSTYEIEPGTPDRKKLPIGAIYTTLDDISHVLVTAAGAQIAVDTGSYYVAYGAKWASATISGSGRAQFTGYFTGHYATGVGGGGLFGEYDPVYRGSLGDAPLYHAVCECAPGRLVAVVSPSGQYLSSEQTRHLALIDAGTGALLSVSTALFDGATFPIEVPVQVSCYEQGEVVDGALARYPALLLTLGDDTLGGVFTTRDLGATQTRIVTSGVLRSQWVHYLGSPLGPARIGTTTGSPPLAPSAV